MIRLELIYFKLKKNFVYIILILLLCSTTNFFTNLYSLYKRDYTERLIRTYGYCNGTSYGYIQKIYEKFIINDKKIYIINFEIVPESYGLFPNIKKDFSINNLLLLNYKKNNEPQLEKYKIDLKNYKLIDSEDACFFYRKD
jgi:hypothetical protein